MDKKLEKRIIIIAIVLAFLGVGGYGLYRVQSASKKKTEATTTQNQGKDTNSTEKTDNPPSAEANTNNDTPAPTTNTNVGVLGEVSLTVYLQSETTTSQDGKTTIAAGSIIPYFYLPGGIYTVQKMVGTTWKDVASNVNYPGHGGLLASFAGSTEDNINYRVLQLEGGAVKSVSKTFVVKRSDITGGIKTYN
jgi:cytoskeletal protein RodZ